MRLPDISTSVAFWAGIATLWTAAGAWFTFKATALKTRQDTYEGIRNLLVGLTVELDFIKQWASGGEGDLGYVLSSDPKELAESRPDWFNPSRYIFDFETPTLQNFTLSPYVGHLAAIVRPLVKLNYSFRRLYGVHADYRAFATNNPSLYAITFRKLKQKAPASSQEELDYANAVFDYNLRMHRDLIGGAKSTDELCLYKAYRSAKDAVEDFALTLKPEPLPQWFRVLDIVAAFLALGGALQVLRWFSILRF